MKSLKSALILYLLIFIIWTLYRYFFKFPEWADEFIYKPLIMLLPVLFFIKIFEKNSLESIGITNKKFFKNVLIGLIAGIFISFEAVMTNQFKNGSITFNPENLAGISLLIASIIPFSTGFVEEAAFRGFFMNRFWQKFNNELTANLLSTILFVSLHLPILLFIQKLNSYDLSTSLIQLFVLGAFDGYIFARTKSITAPTITHGLWNLSAILFR